MTYRVTIVQRHNLIRFDHFKPNSISPYFQLSQNNWFRQSAQNPVMSVIIQNVLSYSQDFNN